MERKVLTWPLPIQEAACLLLVNLYYIIINRHEGVKHFG